MRTFKRTSEMVERVGEALSVACMEEFGATWNYDVRQKFARAAIEAMREPTFSMANAGMHIFSAAPVDTGWRDLARESGNLWQAMIDAAL